LRFQNGMYAVEKRAKSPEMVRFQTARRQVMQVSKAESGFRLTIEHGKPINPKEDRTRTVIFRLTLRKIKSLIL
jgi:hypothetical protein